MRINLITALGILSVSVPIHAQWAVVDIDAVAQLTKQVSQQAQHIQIAKNQYDQMKAMAQRMYNLGRYRGPSTSFAPVQYADQYATLARWTSCETTGANCDRLILDDTGVVAQANSFLTTMDAGLAASSRAMYSTQQVMDGNNLAAMQAVGEIRKAAADYKTAIGELEADSENEDDAAQSELAVEQRTSNAAVMQLHMSQDLNRLIAAQLDQQIAQTKLTRDQLSDGANQAVNTQQSYDSTQSVYSGLGSTWTNWKIWQ